MSKEISERRRCRLRREGCRERDHFRCDRGRAGERNPQTANQEELDVRVSIDRETGDYETFRRWEVVDDEAVVFTEEEARDRTGEAARGGASARGG